MSQRTSWETVRCSDSASAWSASSVFRGTRTVVTTICSVALRICFA